MEFGYRNLRYEESAMDTSHPEDLIVPYTRVMTVSAAYLTGPIHSIAMVGLGGGRTINYLVKSIPALHVDVAELDPKVVDLAGKYFGVRSGGGVRIYNADGRIYLRNTPSHYDLIFVDAYRGPFVPFHLTTREFYQLIKRKLNAHGVMVQNIDPSTLFFDSTIKTVKSVFANVDVYPADGNIVIVSYDGPRLSDAELTRRAKLTQATYGFRYSLPTLVAGRDSNPPTASGGSILTDDFAPVELQTTVKRNNVKRQ